MKENEQAKKRNVEIERERGKLLIIYCTYCEFSSRNKTN